MKNKVLYYFEQLSKIPHGTGNEEQISNFLVDFAKKRNLQVTKDKYNNVLISKFVNNGPCIILQSHTDMVCVKEPDYNIDFKTQPIKLQYNGDYLSAYKTSLGADNGIGVAIILSILDENIEKNIQAFFTTDEEGVMTGASKFDYSLLKSNTLISLDGLSEKEIIYSCASICDMKVTFPTDFCSLPQSKQGYKIVVSGLKGGHSGNDINKNIGNAINIVCELLKGQKGILFSSFEGGNQFNFIPNYCEVTFVCDNTNLNIDSVIKKLQKEYPTLSVTCSSVLIDKALSQKQSQNLFDFLTKIDTGVICGSADNIVLSQNLSSVSLNNGLIKISQRGHNVEEENKNISFLSSLALQYGLVFKVFDKQPGFYSLPNSQLITNLCEINKALFNVNLQPTQKHVSLESCIFKQYLPDLQIAIISPKIINPHSTTESVYIPSINDCYLLLKTYLTKF